MARTLHSGIRALAAASDGQKYLTAFHAFTAANAFIVIDNRGVVLMLGNRVRRAMFDHRAWMILRTVLFSDNDHGSSIIVFSTCTPICTRCKRGDVILEPNCGIDHGTVDSPIKVVSNMIDTDTFKNKDSAEKCPDFARIVKESSDDVSLFAQIVECFSDRLAGFANYYCRDHSLGEDAFQDAMMIAMTKLDQYRGDSPIEPWLRRIVVSACSRLRRGRKNDPSFNQPLDKQDVAPWMADAAPDQELQIMLAQRLELVRGEMEKLKEPNRSLLVMHDVKEVPISELAQTFDLTEEGVKSRLKRSRAMVRQNLLDRL